MVPKSNHDLHDLFISHRPAKINFKIKSPRDIVSGDLIFHSLVLFLHLLQDSVASSHLPGYGQHRLLRTVLVLFIFLLSGEISIVEPANSPGEDL